MHTTTPLVLLLGAVTAFPAASPPSTVDTAYGSKAYDNWQPAGYGDGQYQILLQIRL